jgi:hypothetical protein
LRLSSERTASTTSVKRVEQRHVVPIVRSTSLNPVESYKRN